MRSRLHGRARLALAVAASVAMLGVASASPLRPRPGTRTTPELISAAAADGRIDRETSLRYLAHAFTHYELLPAEFRSNAPWDGTLALFHLREAVATLPAGATREAIETLLAGTCSGYSGKLANSVQSAHFFIEYGTIGGGLTIADYADSLDTAWDTEVTAFGWAAPPVYTPNPAPGNKYHVRVQPMSGGLYGITWDSGTYAGNVGNNPNTPWFEPDAHASCIVINSDMSGFPSPPRASLDSTTAHEFNHSLQIGYGDLYAPRLPDDAFIEGGASWMEDEVYDYSNDSYNFLWPDFTMCMGEYTDSPYAYWIVWRGLTEPHGTAIAGGGEQIMQDFWEVTSRGSGDNLGALQAALSGAGTNLADAYHAFAIAVRFNRACGGGYAYPYCLEEGPGYVALAGANLSQQAIAAVGQTASGTIADNYALNWIDLPVGGPAFDALLTNTSGGGALRGSLVCDTGSALAVRPFPQVASAGTSTSLTGVDPSGCAALVAVLTNQAQTALNPTSCATRTYTLELSTATTAAAPLLLKAVKEPTLRDVVLTWTGAQFTYTVARGTSPTGLADLGPPVVPTTYRDVDALPPAPPDRYFYDVR